jgi:hypothetical protein
MIKKINLQNEADLPDSTKGPHTLWIFRQQGSLSWEELEHGMEDESQRELFDNLNDLETDITAIEGLSDEGMARIKKIAISFRKRHVTAITKQTILNTLLEKFQNRKPKKKDELTSIINGTAIPEYWQGKLDIWIYKPIKSDGKDCNTHVCEWTTIWDQAPNKQQEELQKKLRKHNFYKIVIQGVNREGKANIEAYLRDRMLHQATQITEKQIRDMLH